MEGLISVDGNLQYFIDGYIIHPTQSVMIRHDLSYRKVDAEQIFNQKHSYRLEYNPGNGPWLYAFVNGIKSSTDFDIEW